MLDAGPIETFAAAPPARACCDSCSGLEHGGQRTTTL